MAGSTSAALPDAGAPIPGGLFVQAREPLDSKYWVSNYAGLATGLTYAGILRFDKSTNKLYINLAGTWSEIPTSVAASSSSFTIGPTTTGSPAAVTNTGTAQNPTLNFTIPAGATGNQGIQGLQGIVGNTGTTGSQGPQFTINAVGLSAGRTDYNATAAIGFTYLVNDSNAADDGKYYVYQGTNVWSSPVPFRGATGKSIYIAYAETYDGNGRTFIQGAKTIFISFLSGTVQPSINAFSLWSPISAPAGTGTSISSDTAKLTRSGDTITGDILNTSTGIFQIPSGTTLQRPNSITLANGMRRYNIDTNRDEFYANNVWQNHARLAGDTFSGAIAASNLSNTNTGDNAANTLYTNDYRLANFVAGTNYLLPTGSAVALTNFPTFNQNTTGNAATATNLTGLTTSVATLNNTSGTNTGDNATNTQYSGLATSKQDILVSATNIKSINGASILGAGDLTVTGITAATLASTITAATSKPTPVDADEIGITDSATSYLLKKLTWANAKATLKTYYDTIYTTTSAVSTQITTALSGYATQSYVTSQGFITNVVTALGYTPLNKAGDTITGDINNTSTGFFRVPTGTAGQQPATPLNGMMRYNITTLRHEFFSNGLWRNHARLEGDVFTGAISASNLSNTNTGDQTTITGNAGTVTTNANLTGDVTSVGNAATIVSNIVTNAKLAQMATKTYKGRTSALTGNVEDLSVLVLKTDLSLDLVNNTSDAAKPISTLTQAAFNTYIDVLEYNASLSDISHTYLETSTLVEIKKSPGVGTIQFSRNNGTTFTAISAGTVSSVIFNINELIIWRVVAYNATYTTGTIQLKIIIS